MIISPTVRRIMRRALLYALSVLLALVGGTSAADIPLQTDVTPTFTFSETYKDEPVYDSEAQSFSLEIQTTQSISAKVSMKDVPIAEFNESTEVMVSAGNYVYRVTFGEDENYVPGATRVSIPLRDFDDNSIGSVLVTWSQAQMTIAISQRDTPDNMILATTYVGLLDPVIEDVTAIYSVRLSIAAAEDDYALEGRLVYSTGSSKLITKTVTPPGGGPGELFEDLASISLTGAIDSTLPEAAITAPVRFDPSKPSTVLHNNTVTVEGTYSDDHGVALVELRINDADFVPATLDGLGNWKVENVVLSSRAEGNSLVVRITDLDGLVRIYPPANASPYLVKYSSLSTLRVDAAGTAAGVVSSSLFKNTEGRSNPINYAPGQMISVRTIDNLEEGDIFTITVTPGTDAIFNGWTAQNGTLSPAQTTAEKLVFAMQTDLRLTANFAPNPFLSLSRPLVGVYDGLVTSATPANRGSFTGKISKKGAFSGKLKIGKLSLSLKGKFTGSGVYATTVKKSGVIYTIQLALAVSGNGPRLITGTVTSSNNSVTASIAAAINPFSKLIPTPLVGTYNVLLPPDTTNTDPKFPAGWGYGTFKIKPDGKTKFAGKFADKSSGSASATISELGDFPIHIPLYGKLGSLNGMIRFDSNHADYDATGSLDFFKPIETRTPEKKVFGFGFAGRSELRARLFSKPTPGNRLFLPTNGAGNLALSAPATTVGTLGFTALSSTDNVTLGTDNKIAAPVDLRKLSVSVTPSSGAFKGAFQETQLGKKLSLSWKGVVLQPKGAGANAGGQAGGYFTRGLHTGAAVITP